MNKNSWIASVVAMSGLVVMGIVALQALPKASVSEVQRAAGAIVVKPTAAEMMTPTWTPTAVEAITPGPPPPENVIPTQQPLVPDRLVTPVVFSEFAACRIGIGIDAQGWVVYVSPGYPAELERILQKGDRVLSLASISPDFELRDPVTKATPNFYKMRRAIEETCERQGSVQVVIERNGMRLELAVTPTRGVERDVKNEKVEPEPDGAMWL
jgi:hypothetical protein